MSILLLALALLSPDLQRRPLARLDAGENFAAFVALQVLLVQECAHAGVIQTGGATHADAPLRLHAMPASPCEHVVGPQIGDALRLLPVKQPQLGDGRRPCVVGVRLILSMQGLGFGNLARHRTQFFSFAPTSSR